jgi:hypothetical protein
MERWRPFFDSSQVWLNGEKQCLMQPKERTDSFVALQSDTGFG